MCASTSASSSRKAASASGTPAMTPLRRAMIVPVACSAAGTVASVVTSLKAPSSSSAARAHASSACGVSGKCNGSQ
jgi:hypothetical protein